MTLSDRRPEVAGWRMLEQLKRMLAQEWNPGAGCASAIVPVAAEPLPRHLCVLVVDGDALNLLVTSEMLRFWGVHPLLAQDGGEAVALATELSLDLVLMDLQMPRLGGTAAAREIRRLEQEGGRKRVPIIAFSSTEAAPAELQACGIDGRLDKPGDLNALRDCMLQWCPTLRRAAPGDRQAAGRTHWAALAPGRHIGR